MMADTGTANREVALHLAKQGLSVFPCQSGGAKAKQPMPFLKWRDVSTTNEAQIAKWWQKWPDAAVGLDLAKSGLVVIDADRHGEEDGVEAFGRLMSEHGFDPDSAPLVATPNEGNHHFFRQPPGHELGNGRGNLPRGVDVRGFGGYVVAPGTVMADGRQYELFGNLSAAPVIPDWLVTIIGERKSDQDAEKKDQSFKFEANGNQHRDGRSLAEMRDLLFSINADCGYDDWYQALMAVHAETGGSAKGLDLVDDWSARGSKYKGRREIEAKWRSFKRSGVTGSTLAELARQHGADLRKIAIDHMEQTPVPQSIIDSADAILANWMRKAGVRQVEETEDGDLIDAETGEVIDRPTTSVVPRLSMAYPPGLVGEIARWIVATARRPQPELAIGAALAIVGTAAGRQFRGPTRSATHLYVLGLAQTGTGKDHALQQISRIMASAGMALHLGPSEFISMPAVVNFIVRKPLSLCAMDEFGSFMKRINSRRASGFETAISKIIRTMWSMSFAPYATPEWAQKESQMVLSPAMSLYGASTPEQFYSAMEGASLEDGTLNRFLLINGRNDVEEVEPEVDPSIVPDHIAEALKSIYFRSGDMATAFRNDANSDPAAARQLREVEWCPDGAQERYQAFSQEISAIMRKDAESGAFHARTVEMAVRIATIVAIGRCEDDQVRMADLEYGIEAAMASARMMSEGAADYMADNENQANAQKVMRILKAKGGRARYRDVVVAMKHSVKARDLRDMLQSMVDAGQLERQEVKPQSGGHPIIWFKRL